ncbi:FMRFamide-activated amiloride-sensitive sodium channel [Caerostris darwini]|uniref:FMRFamide-activated amiloride-sensitive sodium channel n=1 Tax=Caerostris darwini TaxID=1538125 RepID=A0AAV4P4G1_9ARAC|nr:FMRFamide-activated amiloride-sensitive sodium channel [Caerostris darwini]
MPHSSLPTLSSAWIDNVIPASRSKVTISPFENWVFLARSTYYEMTISAAEWPTRKFYDMFMKDEKPPENPCANVTRKQNEVNFIEQKQNDSSSESNELPPPRRTMILFPNILRMQNCKEDCTDDEEKDYLSKKSQVVKLKVFYQTLEESFYKQEPMFQESELFSQLGGQLGLWLGISLVALFECVENISHLVHYCIKRSGLKKRNLQRYLPSERFAQI